jgi:ATP-dependent Clp protease adaptor protein ClpS
MEYEEPDEYAEPEQYRVVLMDEYNPIDPFLDAVLMDKFNKSLDETIRLADEIKLKGRATVGAYTWDIAVSKARDVLKLAKEFGSTLQCMLLDEDDTPHKVTYTAEQSANQASDPNSVTYNTY